MERNELFFDKKLDLLKAISTIREWVELAANIYVSIIKCLRACLRNALIQLSGNFSSLLLFAAYTRNVKQVLQSWGSQAAVKLMVWQGGTQRFRSFVWEIFKNKNGWERVPGYKLFVNLINCCPILTTVIDNENVRDGSLKIDNR